MFNIKVDPNSYVPSLVTLVRNVLISASGGWFVLTDDDATKIATGIVTVGLALYGSWKTYHNNEKMKTMEPYVPEAIATTK